MKADFPHNLYKEIDMSKVFLLVRYSYDSAPRVVMTTTNLQTKEAWEKRIRKVATCARICRGVTNVTFKHLTGNSIHKGRKTSEGFIPFGRVCPEKIDLGRGSVWCRTISHGVTISEKLLAFAHKEMGDRSEWFHVEEHDLV